MSISPPILPFRPIIRPIIRPTVHHWVIIDGPEPLKSPPKLVLQENVSRSVFYIVILGKMGQKGAKLVNSAQFRQVGS